jgi:hypothetical protein
MSTSSIMAAAGAMTVVSMMSISAAGQTSGAQIPRTADGRPNLQGIWQAVNTAAWDIQDHTAGEEGPGGQGIVEGNEIPYQPWASTKKKENFEKRTTSDPQSKCYLPGVPRIMYMPFPFQIFQTPQLVAMTFEYVHATRSIYTNGTRHPAPDAIDFWMGDSRGRWEGDTLVVDVANNNDQTWFDKAGNFHSDALHLVERYTLADTDHITYEVTVEDPKVFTRPWKMSMPLYRHKERNFQLLDYECYVFDDAFVK